MTASSGDNDLVADTVRWKTVCAAACNGAGRFFIETKCMWRGGDILYTGKTGTDICNNFIHACNDKYLFRSLDQAGNTITITINIDQLTI